MTATQDVIPADAIIHLGDGRYSVDAARYVLAVLREDWNAGHTNGHTPRIEHQENVKKVRFSDNDHILIYTVSHTERPHTITYSFTSTTTTLTLDFYTARSRSHTLRMVEEARRVLLSHRSDTYGTPDSINLTGRQWLEWGVRHATLDNVDKGLYRRSIDTVIHWRFREIET